jgi:enamine deaminase RidA (YjgF/YER057c/UK114 family)
MRHAEAAGGNVPDRHTSQTARRVRKDRWLVYGVASLPMGSPVELEAIFEVAE